MTKTTCNVNVPEAYNGDGYLSLPVQIQNMKFEEDGIYNVEILINGKESKKQLLHITKTEVLNSSSNPAVESGTVLANSAAQTTGDSY